ncbi:MAG: hypothetical protein ACE37K_15340 [Planctomycetota bacterium]
MQIARILTAAALGALLSASLGAQNVVYHGNTSTTTGGPNAYPLGKEGIRCQQLIPGSVFGGLPSVINDVYFNMSNYGGLAGTQIYFDDIEIQMSSTPSQSLSSDYAANMPFAQLVYRGPLLVNLTGDAWSPIGLPLSYVFVPFSPTDNLVVDFTIWSVADSGAMTPNSLGHYVYFRTDTNLGIERAVTTDWTTLQPTTAQAVDDYGAKMGFLLFDGQFVAHLGSCPGSSGAVPRIGAQPGTWPVANSTFDVELTDGPSNSLAALVLSLETTNYLGVPLPFDMAPIGAAGCTFWHGSEVAFAPVLTDVNGAATQPLVFPAAFPGGIRFYGSWLTLDANANALGIVPSGFATMSL